MTNEEKYQELLVKTKRLRARARRLEAQGKFFEADTVRAQVEGLRHEMLYMREHWSRSY